MISDRKSTGDGFVVWIEGLPGSGKSTLSKAVATKLRAERWKVEVLDGDEVRKTFFPELGYSRKDRETHARRVSQLARLLTRQGTAVLVAMITPYETSRQAARAEFPKRFTEVWLRCPLEVCQQRDPKGLYGRSRAGTFPKMTGMDDPFEEPLNPDLVVDTATQSIEAAARQIMDHIGTIKFLAVPAP
jgi:adenylylsulfate kinase